MFDKELNLIKSNKEALALYLDGMSALHRSGVISFLRAYGRVFRAPKATMEEVALDGAYSAGFQDAIDTLFNFKEYFLDPRPNTTALQKDYGGIKAAMLRGDLTEEEANEFKRTGATGSR